MSSLERLTDGVPLNRRALAWPGGLGLTAVLPGCADDDPATTPSTSVSQGTADCVLMPGLTEGPYYTRQLFFDEATIAAAYESDAYAGRGAPDTSNEADGIYGESGGSTVVALTPGETYRGSVTLGVQRT